MEKFLSVLMSLIDKLPLPETEKATIVFALLFLLIILYTIAYICITAYRKGFQASEKVNLKKYNAEETKISVYVGVTSTTPKGK